MARFVSLWRRRPDAVVAAALAVSPFVVWSRALPPGRVLSPVANLFATYPWSAIGDATGANPALTDITDVFHPWILYAARRVAAGEFPFWNPYSYAGAPFFSNAQTALLFPLTALAYVLPVTTALTLGAVLKPAIAGVGTYAFCRVSLGVSRPSSAVAALGFMYGTPLVAWLQWTFASTTALLPWLFLAVDRACDGGRRAVAGLAVVVALLGLAGYPQGAFHAALVAGAWAVARSASAGIVPGLGLWRPALGVALGIGVAAVQWLPFIDYARDSAVIAYRAAWTPAFAVSPSAAVTALMPTFFGTGDETWSAWQFGITSLSVGLVPLLTLPGIVFAPRWRGVAFFALLGAATAAVHFGVPGVRQLAAAPGAALGTNLRLMPVIAFAAAVLGALGLDALRAYPVAGARVVRATFVALLALGVLAAVVFAGEPRAQAMTWPLPLQLATAVVLLTAAALATLACLRTTGARTIAALVAAQAASVVPLAATYHPVADAAALYPVPPSIAWLAARGDGARAVMPGSIGMLYGIREAHGYDGLTPARVERLLGPVGTGEALRYGYLTNPLALHGSEPLAAGTVLLSPALDRAGVRYAVMPAGAAPPRPGWPIAHDGQDARVFVNADALPRARVVAHARCVDDAAALRALRAAAVSRDETLLAGCTTTPAPGGGGEATIVVDAPERVVVRAVAAAPAHLVLLDTWFPGWRAWIDGHEVDVLRADYAFRAVPLPAGQHVVEFRFRPRRLTAGLAVSLVALGAVVALAARGRRWLRRTRVG